ncbi:MAG: methylated-DNA--[protein]-cysteine S-methyltransferase [Deltaproteobacteria bacterium]|nr:methylated-DNA--[protein]-cysteine S-methyltransferase [Deltaproteobacteria bacterium]
MWYERARSPLGEILIAADDDALRAVLLPTAGEASKPPADWQRRRTALLDEAKRQIEAYFDGTRYEFKLPLAPTGTDFELEVWKELSRVPFGATVSYGDVARRIGKPKATRAVGAACGKNPLPLVIPCHRVIAAGGGLGGFSGGLHLKRSLLSHEAAVARS